MKKLLLLVFLIIISCSRDSEKEIGNKYISKISIDANNYYSFSYKNKQLNKIICKEGNAITEVNIQYQNNTPYLITLNSMNVNYNAYLTYNNGNLTQITKNYSDNTKIISSISYNSENKIKKIVSNDGNRDFEIVTFDYQSNIITSSNSRNFENYTMTYDDKKNPYYNINKGIIITVFVTQGEIIPEYINTENNLIKSSTQKEIFQYNHYTYLDNLPIERTDEKNLFTAKFEYVNL